MHIIKSCTRTAALLLLLMFATAATGIARVESHRAAYAGGTARVFPGARTLIEGRIDANDEDVLTFTATDKAFAGDMVSIPYARVTHIEYGQKAGRRVGAAMGYSVVLGPVGLLALLSKKRHHYVTVGYEDRDGIDQAVVFEIGKDIIRETLASVEARSGQKVLYQRNAVHSEGTW